jgi:hypothetical protein
MAMDVEYFHLRLPESEGIHPTYQRKKKIRKKTMGHTNLEQNKSVLKQICDLFN